MNSNRRGGEMTDLVDSNLVAPIPSLGWKRSVEEHGWGLNARNKADGLHLMSVVPDGEVSCAFFDPQYRGGLDKMGYGDEGKGREKHRHSLEAMSPSLIGEFIKEIGRCLRPSGHLFLWLDKFELLNGFQRWIEPPLNVVDMLVWDKTSFGMGYRTRRQSEFLVVVQKDPKRAKGVWKDKSIPDVVREKKPKGDHQHRKPFALQKRLIEAVTEEGDVVLDPSAGSFGVMHAAFGSNRVFYGGDING